MELVRALLFVGIVAGLLARLFVPGRDAIGFWWTVLLGIVGAILVLLIWRAVDSCRTTSR